MSCCCNNSYYGKPCCCPPYTTTTTTMGICDGGETCVETFTTDCVIYQGVPISLSCLNIQPGDRYTQILQALINNLSICASTTTTTTTTAGPIPCYCYIVSVTEAFGSCSVSWIDCDGQEQNALIDPSVQAAISICAQEDTITSQCFDNQNCQVTGGASVCSIDDDCPTPPEFCKCYYLSVPDDAVNPLFFVKCGETIQRSVNPGESRVYCVKYIVSYGDGIASSLGNDCTVDDDCSARKLTQMCFIVSYTDPETSCSDTAIASMTPTGIYKFKPYYQLSFDFTNCSKIINAYIVYNDQLYMWEFWLDPDPFDPTQGPRGILVAYLPASPSSETPESLQPWININPGTGINSLMSSESVNTNGICTLELATVTYNVNTCSSGGIIEMFGFGELEFSEITPYIGSGNLGSGQYLNGSLIQVTGATPADGNDTIITVTIVETSDVIINETFPPGLNLPDTLKFYTIGGYTYEISVSENCPTTLAPSFCYTAVITGGSGQCTIEWTNPDGKQGSSIISDTKTKSISFCAQPGTPTIALCTGAQTAQIEGGILSCTVDGDCPPAPIPCDCYFLTVPDSEFSLLPIVYTACGETLSSTVSKGESIVACVQTITDLGDGQAYTLPSNCSVDGDCPTYPISPICFVLRYQQSFGELVCDSVTSVSATPSGIYNGRPYYLLDPTFTFTDPACEDGPSAFGIAGYYIIYNSSTSPGIWEFWSAGVPFDPTLGPDIDYDTLFATLPTTISTGYPFLPVAPVYWEQSGFVSVLTSSNPVDTNDTCNADSALVTYSVDICGAGGIFDIFAMNQSDAQFISPITDSGPLGKGSYYHGTQIQVAGTTPDGGDTVISIRNVTTSTIVFTETLGPGVSFNPNTPLAGVTYLVGGDEYLITIIQQGCHPIFTVVE